MESFSELLSGSSCLETRALSALRPFDGPGYPPSVYILAPVDAAAIALLPPALTACPGDPRHVLYIGATSNTSCRLQRLIGTVRPGTSGQGHPAGDKMRLCLGIDSPILVDLLAVSIYATDRPNEVEDDLITAYERSYGARPLLNRERRLLDKTFTNVLRVAEICASQSTPGRSSASIDKKHAPVDDSLMSASHGREAGEGSL